MFFFHSLLYIWRTDVCTVQYVLHGFGEVKKVRLFAKTFILFSCYKFREICSSWGPYGVLRFSITFFRILKKNVLKNKTNKFYEIIKLSLGNGFKIRTIFANFFTMLFFKKKLIGRIQIHVYSIFRIPGSSKIT